jgi:DNA-binding NarL/FixJ family response regulator
MDTRVPVYVQAVDPVSEAGLTSQLRRQPEIRIVERLDDEPAAVAVVAVDNPDEEAVRRLRKLTQRGCAHIVLVVGQLDDNDLLAVLDAGVSAVVRRVDVTPARLAELATRAAAGEPALPSDMVGRLIQHVSRLQHQVLSPLGLTMSGLSSREIQVLRLVADGFGTHDIAHELSFSERTVKNILHGVMSRLQLRNRSHAVAYAIREGLI